MAYTPPISQNAHTLIKAADWNTYVKANIEHLKAQSVYHPYVGVQMLQRGYAQSGGDTSGSVTFSPAFSARPAIALAGTGNNPVSFSGESASGFTFTTWGHSGQWISWIAVGPQ